MDSRVDIYSVEVLGRVLHYATKQIELTARLSAKIM
jgi:hypothetical protein